MHLIAKATRKSRAKFISIDLAFGMVASLDGLLHLVYLPYCRTTVQDIPDCASLIFWGHSV